MLKKLKVALLSESLNTHSGSRAPIELALALSLHPRIKRVYFYCFQPNHNPKIKKILNRSGIRVVLLPAKNLSFIEKCKASLKLKQHLKTHPVDVLSFHGTLPLYLASRISGILLITTYYGTQFDAYLERFLPDTKPSLTHRLLNLLANLVTYFLQAIPVLFSNQVIAMSDYGTQELIKLYRKKTKYIYLGSNPTTIPRPRTAIKLPNYIRLLSVSRITPYKGFHKLIRIASEINRKSKMKVKLTLAGSSAKKNYLSYLHSIKDEHTDIIVNPSDSKLGRLYHDCDIYVAADRYLFFGLPPLEAATFAIPSVLLDYCSAREIVLDGQTGFIATDEQYMVRKLSVLINRPQLRISMGKQAKNRVLQSMTWKQTAQKYVAEFNRQLHSHTVSTSRQSRKKFLLPLLTAFFISLIFGLQHLIVPALLGENQVYTPLAVNHVPLLTYEETWSYAAQTREVFDGKWLVSDYHLAEYQTLPPSLLWLSPLLIGTLSKLLGSVSSAFIVSDFLLPPLIFLILFFLIFSMTSATKLSTLGAVLVLTANRLFQFLPPLTLTMVKTLLNIFWIDGSEVDPLEFSRLFHPQLVFLFLSLYLFFLYSSLKKKNHLKILFAVFFLGTLFYSYFYYWTFALAGTAVLTIISWIRKQYSQLKTLSVILIFGALISLPYWFWYFQFQKLASAPDVLARVGLEPGRIKNTLRSAQFLIFAFLFSKLVFKKDLPFWFLLAFLLGGVICLNLQLLTGFTIQSWHWAIRALNPLSIIMLAFLGYRLFHQHYPSLRLNHWKKSARKTLYPLLLNSLLAIFIFRSLLLHTVVAKNTYQGYSLPNPLLETYDWLNNHTPPDSVVVTPSFTSIALLPVYTRNNTFVPYGAATFASDAEITLRFLYASKLFGISRHELEKKLSYSGDGFFYQGKYCSQGNCAVDSDLLEDQAIILLYFMKNLDKSEGLTNWSWNFSLSQPEKENILKTYDRIAKIPSPFPQGLQVDYLFFGPSERKMSNLDFSTLPYARKVFDNREIQIYKLNQPSINYD